MIIIHAITDNTSNNNSMGNQQGKSKGVVIKYDPTTVGTRETIAAWHRFGVSVWDVYESIDSLGQGHMGTVYQVRRKDRGLHNEATRHAAKANEKVDVDKTPKISIRKALRPIKKVKSMSKVPPEEDEEDRPPEVKPAQPPKSPSAPKSILKKSQYSNPTLKVPDLDDEPEDEEAQETWKARTKDRVEHIQSHKAEILQADQDGELSYSSRAIDPLSDARKVFFKRHYACKTVLTSRVKDGRLAEMMNEIYVMRSLDHPYILNLYEIYQTKRMYL